MDGVSHVLNNRLNLNVFGVTLADVCVRAAQFSCWNTNDPNRAQMARLRDDDPVLQQCKDSLSAAISGLSPDPTFGATHYYDKRMMNPPTWRLGATQTAEIGNHLFWKDVK